MNIQQHRNKIEQIKGQKFQLQKDLEIKEKELQKLNRDLINTEQAQIILQTVAKQTQQQIEFHISELVTLALVSVFDNEYSFKIEFIEKRGKTEAELWFLKNKEKITPEMDGGGVIDVAAFALRLALWKLLKSKSINTLLLDEPFKHLKGLKENKRVIQMIKMLSEKLNLQIIMVHDERVPFEEIEKGADKIFFVSIKNGESKVHENSSDDISKNE